MKAVVNAGPLIALGKLGQVHLLSLAYDSVLIPSAVYEEVVERGMEYGQPDAYAVQLAVARRELSVRVVEVADVGTGGTASPLQRGEWEAIQLALSERADWVLLNDQLAREHAQRFGLHVKGTLGVIVEAYRRDLVSSAEVELIFQAIVDRDDIWISDGLVRRVRDALLSESDPDTQRG